METDNVILEHLRAIRSDVSRLVEDMREVKGRLGILEPQYASLSNRLDRMDERVARMSSDWSYSTPDRIMAPHAS